jgi:hypothetical protein
MREMAAVLQREGGISRQRALAICTKLFCRNAPSRDYYVQHGLPEPDLLRSGMLCRGEETGKTAVNADK